MAATLAEVQAAQATLDADVDKLIAQHATNLDGVLAQTQATDAKVQAALTPAAPAPTPAPAA